jgi:DNA-binding CsgD family transcriptional regulator
MSLAWTRAGRTPDAITPLVGYRCWTLMIGLGHEALHSLNGEIVREVNLDDPLERQADPWLVARCLRDDHDAPEEDCSCGFYALKAFSTLGRIVPFVTRPLLYAGEAEHEAAFPVAGQVDLAGKVIEHDLGYRAERMRITELRAFAGTEQTVTQFARHIGVPVGESIPAPGHGPISRGSLSGSLARLTPREVDVLRLLASGSSSTKIAAELSISPLTARRHVRDILAKLQVHSGLEAVARMRRHPPPPDSAA